MSHKRRPSRLQVWILSTLQLIGISPVIAMFLVRLSQTAGDVRLEPVRDPYLFLLLTPTTVVLSLVIMAGLLLCRRWARNLVLVLYPVFAFYTCVNLVQHIDWLGRLSVLFVDTSAARRQLREHWIALLDPAILPHVDLGFLTADLWLWGLVINLVITLFTMFYLLRPLMRDLFLYHDPPRKGFDEYATPEERRTRIRFIWD